MLNMQLLVLACNKSQPIYSGGEEEDLLWKYQDSVVFRIALVAGQINKVRPEERAVGLTRWKPYSPNCDSAFHQLPFDFSLLNNHRFAATSPSLSWILPGLIWFLGTWITTTALCFQMGRQRKIIKDKGGQLWWSRPIIGTTSLQWIWTWLLISCPSRHMPNKKNLIDTICTRFTSQWKAVKPYNVSEPIELSPTLKFQCSAFRSQFSTKRSCFCWSATPQDWQEEVHIIAVQRPQLHLNLHIKYITLL